MSLDRLQPERIERVTGFGMHAAADGYVYRPRRLESVVETFELARRSGRRVVLRGSGLSYGDAAIANEAVVIDFTRMNGLISWDPESGIVEAEPGVTIGDLWRLGIEDGWWPPVVSGTMHPTLGGALAMNIHGKNAFKAGPIGEHVLEIDVLTPKGQVLTLRPDNALFTAVISGAGLLGVIVRVKMQMKRLHSGDLRVLALVIPNWQTQLDTLFEFEPISDYMVSWVDCFGRGSSAGRGLFHAAWYMDEQSDFPASLKLGNQDLPDTIMGLVPKSVMWRFLKPFNCRPGMRCVNGAKQKASTLVGNNKLHIQSLVAFSFLLDYVPNWRYAYLPGGFIQYQSFVPKERAREVFEAQIRLQRESRLESFLGVLKRHRTDSFLLSHAVDGFSLALDFKVTRSNWTDLQALCHKMNDLVLEAGGRFYFAKDYTLRPEDAQSYLGPAIQTLRDHKSSLDPEGILTSGLAERLCLFV